MGEAERKPPPPCPCGSTRQTGGTRGADVAPQRRVVPAENWRAPTTTSATASCKQGSNPLAPTLFGGAKPSSRLLPILYSVHFVDSVQESVKSSPRLTPLGCEPSSQLSDESFVLGARSRAAWPLPARCGAHPNSPRRVLIQRVPPVLASRGHPAHALATVVAALGTRWRGCRCLAPPAPSS